MRVTKTVQGYIEKEVTKRVYPKYQAEELEAKRQQAIKGDFLKAATEAANEACKKYFDDHFQEIEDFCENLLDKNDNPIDVYRIGQYIRIKGIAQVQSIHGWKIRMNNEIKDKVDDIIITLELGGNRADLEAMLKEIGE